MKLRYFGYFIRSKNTQSKNLYNLKPIIDAFTASTNLRLKGSFQRGNDNLFLVPVSGKANLYYFVRTSDDDFLKRIDVKKLSISDIKKSFSLDEKVAYATYVYICERRNIIAFASSTGCPRSTDFADFLNEFFNKAGLSNYIFELIALTSSIKRKDLLQMEMVNSVYLDVASDKKLGRLIGGMLFGEEDAPLGNFRITVEPTGANLKKQLHHVVNRFNSNDSNDNGLVRIGAKAKHDEFKGQLLDYWLDNEDGLFDMVNPRNKASLEDQIIKKYNLNQVSMKMFDKFVSQYKLTAKEDATLQLAHRKEYFSLNATDDSGEGAQGETTVVPIAHDVAS